MENKLFKLYQKESEVFEWFEGLDHEPLRRLLVATWQIMLWNPNRWPETLVKFYGHMIDGPRVMNFLRSLQSRLDCSEMYSWAVPNEEAIQALVEYSPVVEIGAGRGYWAALAAAAGADILAFDAQPPVKAGVNSWHRQPGTFFSVAQGLPEIAGLHPDRSLFLCWPPWNSDVLSQAVRSYTGKTVIYVGDDGHGAGNPQSYAELAAGMTKTRVVNLPRWPGVECRMEVWQRAIWPRMSS
ncbi:MAG: hypothetical protein HYR85_22610 [Planctomycetes bacterium]|nr:hypothetical protein [Planctomycetota bacterium]MBI3843720.1 hypothetical protein [Planctomycetota bacterium]